MNTKKNYLTPATEIVELKVVATLLAGSNEFGASGSIGGRGDLEDPEADYDS